MDTSAVGLCAQCRHSKTVTTARGSVFYRCARAETDPRFTRYPRLPVVGCAGFDAVTEPAQND
jgi:hypothetical protein